MLPFLTYFREMYMGLKQKIQPKPKINDIGLKLEGFKYDRSLHLNMVY